VQQNDIVQFFQRAIKPLKDRVFLMAGKAIIAAVNDASVIQEAQIKVMKGESMERVPRIQDFGFTSNPPAGSEAIVLALGGNRENLVIIATENRNVRMKNLASGETAIYTDDGTYIVLKKAGEVEIKAATKLTIDVPLSLIKGDVKIEGKLDVDLTIEAVGNVTGLNVFGGTTDLLTVKTDYNLHTHISNIPTQPTSIPTPLL